MKLFMLFMYTQDFPRLKTKFTQYAKLNPHYCYMKTYKLAVENDYRFIKQENL